MEDGQRNPIRGKESQEQTRVRDISVFTIRSLKNIRLAAITDIYRGPMQTLCLPL